MLARAPRRSLGRLLFVCGTLATIVATTTPRAWAEPTKTLLALEQPTPAPRKGVVVVGVGDGAADATWPVAQAIYGDGALRPKIEDRDARVLAGAPADGSAPTSTAELSSLRAKIAGDDPASAALLADVARRTGARAVVVVFAPHESTPAQARLFDAADAHLEPTKYEADATRPAAPWGALVDALRARYVPKPAIVAEVPKEKEEKKETSGGFFSSPWFWGALGAAALAGGVVYALTRDNGQGTPAPVRIEWGK